MNSPTESGKSWEAREGHRGVALAAVGCVETFRVNCKGTRGSAVQRDRGEPEVIDRRVHLGIDGRQSGLVLEGVSPALSPCLSSQLTGPQF